MRRSRQTWILVSWTLLASLALATAVVAQRPPDSVAREALVRALALARQSRSPGPTGRGSPASAGTPWDVQVRGVAPAAAALLRDSVLAATGGRLRVPTDTAWSGVGVGGARVAGDSAVLAVSVGGGWCAPGGTTTFGGRASEYVFRRTAGGWAFTHVADVAFNFAPAPPPDPDASAPRGAPAGGRPGHRGRRCVRPG